MIVVPKEAGRLIVGEVVVLVLPRIRDVLGPSVKGRTGWRAMEMHTCFVSWGAVEDSDHSFSADRNDKCGTYTYVRDKASICIWNGCYCSPGPMPS